MNKKIVVIEDDAYEVVLLKNIIKNVWEHDLDFLTSAEDAREALNQSSHDKIELIILDLNLPGTGGLDFLMELRSKYPHIPVVISTGSRRREDVLQALRLGAMDFIEKPLTEERLQACLLKINKPYGEKLSVSIVDEKSNVKSLASLEKELIKKALEFNDNNISKTANELGITRATLYKKIET